MTEQEWGISHARALGLMLGGDPGDKFVSLLGYPEFDDGFLLLMNAHYEAVQFTLPMPGGVPYWRLELDTTWPTPVAAGTRVPAGATFSVAHRSLVLFAWETADTPPPPDA
jgi:glycogen operon protein